MKTVQVQVHELQVTLPHAVRPEFETCPSGQVVQEVAPSTSLTEFTGQSVQIATLSSLYFPAGHVSEENGQLLVEY